MNKNAVVKALSGTAVTFGAADFLAPDALQRAYGNPNSGPELRAMSRLWGSRMLAMAAIGMRTRKDDYNDLLALLGVMSAADVVAALYAGMRDGLPMKTGGMSAM